MLRRYKAVSCALVAILIAISTPTGHANSNDTSTGSPSRPALDLCHAYLEGKSSGTVVSSSLTDHQAAGQAAAMSLLLNVRYSVGSDNGRLAVANEHVQAITAYRQCRKKMALQDIAAAL